MFDIVRKRYWFFALSLLVIVPGLISIGIHWTRTGTPLPLAIDFAGGSLLELQFKATGAVEPGDVQIILAQNGFEDSLVQTSGSNDFVIRAQEMNSAARPDRKRNGEPLAHSPSCASSPSARRWAPKSPARRCWPWRWRRWVF
jgi:preprotein translocase subunit SecF